MSQQPVKRIFHVRPAAWSSGVTENQIKAATSSTTVAVNVGATAATTSAALLAPTDVTYRVEDVETIQTASGGKLSNKRVRYIRVPRPNEVKQIQPGAQNFQEVFQGSSIPAGSGTRTIKTIKFKKTPTGVRVMPTMLSASPQAKNMLLFQNGNLVQICPTKATTIVQPGTSQPRLAASHSIATPPAAPKPHLTLSHSIATPPAAPKPHLTLSHSIATPPAATQHQPASSQSTQPYRVATKEVTIPATPLCDIDVDSQRSDADEDGYSNIDFDDDQYQIIESEENVDEYDPLWTPDLRSRFHIFNYAGEPQPKLKETAPPYAPQSYFDMIIGERAQFFRTLANSCAIRVLNKLKPGSCFQSFTPEELQIFIGICLQMSSLRLHHLDEYWNEKANFGFNGIEEKMTLKRFKTILEALNFDNFRNDAIEGCFGPINNSQTLFDKFVDVRPLLNFFNSRMEILYDCDRKLILNEPMLYWKGKFDWLNEVKSKFRANAVLLHFLTEPSGLILRIVPDLETVDRRNFNRNSKELVRQRLAIALEVLQPKMDKGHIVYASKHYSSYALALELSKRQTYCAGFLDSTRYGNCKEIILTPLEKECSMARFADNIMTGKYRQCHKSMYFYSSDCQAVFTTDNQNVQSSLGNFVKEIKTHLCSTADIRTKMLNCQTLLPTTEIKWDKRFMIYVINLLVLNAYILYTKHATFYKDELPIRYEKFRQEVIASLLNNTSLESGHIIQVLPRLNGNVAKKKCQICCKGGINTYSVYYCEACPGMPGLCKTPCFKIWHDHMNKSLKRTELENEGMAE